jgi:hypothetical protein
MREIYYVIFEGDSERNYMEKLNRFFEEHDISFYFKVSRSFSLNGVVSLQKIIKKCREVKTEAGREKIIIWVDNDLFEREKLNKEELKKK